MYALLVFKKTDQYVNLSEGDDLGLDDLDVHYIQKEIEKDDVWIKMYGVKDFPTFILMHDRKEVNRTSTINYESEYDIKCWIRNSLFNEQYYG